MRKWKYFDGLGAATGLYQIVFPLDSFFSSLITITSIFNLS